MNYFYLLMGIAIIYSIHKIYIKRKKNQKNRKHDYLRRYPIIMQKLPDPHLMQRNMPFGINTVAQSLRNPSYDLRSEAPNPQTVVSPWNQTTIEPDLMTRSVLTI